MSNIIHVLFVPGGMQCAAASFWYKWRCKGTAETAVIPSLQGGLLSVTSCSVPLSESRSLSSPGGLLSVTSCSVPLSESRSLSSPGGLLSVTSCSVPLSESRSLSSPHFRVGYSLWHLVVFHSLSLSLCHLCSGTAASSWWCCEWANFKRWSRKCWRKVWVVPGKFPIWSQKVQTNQRRIPWGRWTVEDPDRRRGISGR